MSALAQAHWSMISSRISIHYLSGLDIDHNSLTLAKKNISSLALIQGNAHQLPYASGVFEICFCHFVLLWVEFPDQVVAEMARVTRSGGSVIAIAEPDYGGRIDYPEAFDQIGDWQARSLQRQGADPHLGRKLIQLFDQAGLTEIEVGVVGGRWTISPAQEGFEVGMESDRGRPGNSPIITR